MHRWLYLAIALGLLALAFGNAKPTEITPKSITLRIAEKEIDINNKKAKIYTLTQPDGTPGLTLQKGQQFNVLLENHITVPSGIHWHGIILPNDQDGVASITQLPLYPSQSYHYKFPILQSGTYWMHSHYGLQEQQQLSAPLILLDSADTQIADQEAVLFLTDFSFKSPMTILENLRNNCKEKSAMAMKHNGPMFMPMDHPDLVEVNYDAFLANSKTLENPDIINVQPGKKVRVRVINGSSATNFFITTGSLESQAIAVDGQPIEPFSGTHFELGTAQRIDLIVIIPKLGGAFPILAQGQGSDMQTGFILATKNATIPKLASKTPGKAGALTNKQEAQLRALRPLAEKPVNQKVSIELGGNMATYIWTLNGQAWPEITPIVVTEGERVEITFKNVTGMAHPMHLHGHVFQVTAIDGTPLKGAMRDTILVMPKQSISIQFDANNPGVWPLHCHVLYHLESGMLTVVRYKDYIQPLIPITKE